MRNGPFTLVGWLPEKPDSLDLIKWMKTSVPETFALYDLSTDPAQANDIAAGDKQRMDTLSRQMITNWLDIRGNPY
jgi:hypothetical protein